MLPCLISDACRRPEGHEDRCGELRSEYRTFRPPRGLHEFVGIPAESPSGFLLSWTALDALSASRTSGLPASLVVTGERRYEDGRRHLTYAAPRDYIEAVSDFRELDGKLVYVCPDCGLRSGKHTKTCSER